MQLRITRAILFCLFIGQACNSAFSSDLRLIRLVPPDSQIIAGTLNSSPQGEAKGFLLITRENTIDLQDFFAVTGADASRVIQQVVFLAGAGRKGILSEHSLLIGGHFNQDAIFRFASSGGATTASYHGVPILVVKALARDRQVFADVRWLVILDAKVAIFGTVASVQRELDRYTANTPADAFLAERLNRLAREDDTWCLLPAPTPGGMVQSLLGKLNPELGAIAKEGGLLQYGVHFGKQVEITASSIADLQADSSRNTDSSASPGAFSFLSRSSKVDPAESKSTVVKVPRKRYQQWLDRSPMRGLTVAGVLSH